MKLSQLKQLIEESCRKVVREELREVKALLLEQQTSQQPLLESTNLNPNSITSKPPKTLHLTSDVVSNFRSKMLEDLGVKSIVKPEVKPVNPIAAKVIQNIDDTNPFKNILAQTANEVNHSTLSNFKEA